MRHESILLGLYGAMVIVGIATIFLVFGSAHVLPCRDEFAMRIVEETKKPGWEANEFVVQKGRLSIWHANGGRSLGVTVDRMALPQSGPTMPRECREAIFKSVKRNILNGYDADQRQLITENLG